MNLTRMYGLFLRHFYLITRSFPRILDLIYWPSIQITLWGFISNFFAIHSTYYNNAGGVILTCAILYDFLFRTSIGFNMLFLEEIWSRNFTNLFIAPMKIGEIIISLIITALIRALIGLVPAIILTSPLFGISILLASHNMNEVTRLCKSILMMKDGIIIDKGTPDELIKKHGRKNLEEVFLKLSRNNNESY